MTNIFSVVGLIYNDNKCLNKVPEIPEALRCLSKVKQTADQTVSYILLFPTSNVQSCFIAR